MQLNAYQTSGSSPGRRVENSAPTDTALRNFQSHPPTACGATPTATFEEPSFGTIQQQDTDEVNGLAAAGGYMSFVAEVTSMSVREEEGRRDQGPSREP